MSIIRNKPKTPKSESPVPESNRISKKRNRKTESPFHGVRKRKWGKYVSEIRLPGQKTRIWLGSFDLPEKAAWAYDSAAFFLKGDSACLNFPESVGLLPRPQSGSREDIQSAAAKAAMMEPPRGKSEEGMNRGDSGSGGDPECTEWWGELETLPFEEVKDCPLLLSAQESLGLVGAEYSWSFVEDDELMLTSCFEL